MIEHVFHPRVTDSKDWATGLFVLAFAIIAITKSSYSNRFDDFMNLLFSDKYIKVYRDSSNLKSTFTIGLFIVQAISFAFLLQIVSNSFGYTQKNDWIVYIQIFTFQNHINIFSHKNVN